MMIIIIYYYCFNDLNGLSSMAVRMTSLIIIVQFPVAFILFRSLKVCKRRLRWSQPPFKPTGRARLSAAFFGVLGFSDLSTIHADFERCLRDSFAVIMVQRHFLFYLLRTTMVRPYRLETCKLRILIPASYWNHLDPQPQSLIPLP